MVSPSKANPCQLNPHAQSILHLWVTLHDTLPSAKCTCILHTSNANFLEWNVVVCCGTIILHVGTSKKITSNHAWVCSTHVLAWMQAMLWGLGECCPRKFLRSQMQSQMQSQTRQWKIVEFCYRHYTDRWLMITRALRAHVPPTRPAQDISAWSTSAVSYNFDICCRQPLPTHTRPV